jgi:hypothetical protein
MKWLMAAGLIETGTVLMPWAHMGAGVVSQPGECPADAPDTDPACKTDVKPGGQLAVGVRWNLMPRLSIGGEAAYIRGMNSRDRHFATRRVGLTIRWQ